MGGIMQQVATTWSTQQAPPSEALSYWRDVVCRNLLDLDIASPSPASFCGQIAKYSFGPLSANFISVTEQLVYRRRDLNSDRQHGMFHLIHVRRGVQNIEQHGRRMTVGPGDCVLIDCDASFDFHCPQGADVLVVEIPVEWLRGWLPFPENTVAHVINGTSAWGVTLASALSNLSLSTFKDVEVPPALVAEQLAVLLALSAAPTGPVLKTGKRAILQQIRNTLRERCHESDLDPAAVACAHRVSRRYVHALFTSAGTTFTQELYHFRLQRAQRLLADKRFAGTSIAEIGWNCGFSEPSHFARRFREHFGISPTSYRHKQVC